MRYLVFGFGSKSGMAVHNILIDFFSYFSESTGNEVVGFGYEENNGTVLINDNFSYVHVKDPFFASRFNRYRITRKFNKVFRKDSSILSWNYAYKKATKKLKNKTFDYVVAAAGNFFYTQAAYKFAKKTNCKLILMYFDPYTNGLGTLNKQYRLKIEKEWYKYSSKILVDKDGSNIPFDDKENKVKEFLIPIFDKYQKEVCDDKIIYGGTLYDGFRGKELLESFINLPISENEKFDLFVGSKTNIKHGQNVTIHDYVPNADYLIYCRKSKAIIVIGNGINSNHIPSKILTAISIKKPVIGLNINPRIDQLRRYPFYFDGDNKYVFNLINDVAIEKYDEFDIYESFPDRHPDVLCNQLLSV